MPPPLDPAKREAIADAIRAGGTRNAIARDHDVSPSTVTKIAQALEADNPDVIAFDRASVKRATEAAQVDLAAEKARLAKLLMADAFRLRDRAWQQQTVAVATKEGVEIVEIPTPAGDFRNFYTSIGIIVDKVGVLTRDDSQGLAAVDSWLRSLGVGATPA